jgi:hypothetical protein
MLRQQNLRNYYGLGMQCGREGKKYFIYRRESGVIIHIEDRKMIESYE